MNPVQEDRISELLEEVSFLFLMPANDTCPEGALATTLTVAGDNQARFTLVATADVVDEMARNILGDMDMELTREDLQVTLGEVLNIIVGRLAPDMWGPQALHDLSPPTHTDVPNVDYAFETDEGGWVGFGVAA